MITKQELKKRQQQAVALFKKAGIVITRQEAAAIETADFGLGEMDKKSLF